MNTDGVSLFKQFHYLSKRDSLLLDIFLTIRRVSRDICEHKQPVLIQLMKSWIKENKSQKYLTSFKIEKKQHFLFFHFPMGKDVKENDKN